MLAPAQTTTERRPLGALADIVEPWRALAGRAAEPNVFYGPDFALAAAPVFGRDAEAVLVWAGPHRLIGLFPLAVTRRRYGIRLALAAGWTHPFAPLVTPLVDRDASDIAIAAFLDHVAGDDALPNLLLLPYLHEAGPVAGALRAALARQGGAIAPFGRHQRAALVPGVPGEGRADYLTRAIGAKRRKELRRQRHRLAEGGAVGFTLAKTPADIAAALEDFMRLEAGGWKGRAGTAIAQQANIARFVQTAIAALAARGEASVVRLTCGAQPIACGITLRSGTWAWGWKIAYDERFAAASPGVQLYLDLTETLLADPGIAVVDSCATPDHPMIDHLWRERLPIADWLVALAPGASFSVARRLETLRRHALAVARGVRARFPSEQGK
jgi:CelD/BcsL family acetyltransferase involved in cellulose biosynthesis